MPTFSIPDLSRLTAPVPAEDVEEKAGVAPATFSITVEGRQEEIARLEQIGASPAAIDNVRYWPATFDPAKPIVCAGPISAVRIGQLDNGTSPNLDFSCPTEIKRSGIFAIGADLDDSRKELGEDVQTELNRAEAQINRTDEELEDFRDEAREGISSTLGGIFGALPGGRFFKFLGFAILAIVLLIIIRIIFGIFRG